MASFHATYVPIAAVDRAAWTAFLSECPDAPVYVQPWYLDAVTDQRWSLVLAYQGKQLVAGLPLFLKHKYVWQYSYQPPFSQTWGPIVHPGVLAQKHPYVKLDRLFASLIKALPEKLADHQFAAPPELTYLRRFHEAGYTLKTRYTFQIQSDALPVDQLPQLYDKQTRKNLNALDALEMQPASTAEYLSILPHAHGHFQSELYTKTGLRLIRAGLDTEQLLLYKAVLEGEVIGVKVIAKDRNCWRSIMGISHEAHRTLSPNTKMFHWAIALALKNDCAFDFEGSMMPAIARYFSRFGGTPVPYINLRRRCLTKLTLPNR
ncbi:MAG: GNAT family N-acetyltransferase [Bacteroidota bacterium]